MSEPDFTSLWQTVTKQFLLGKHSLHGLSRWKRVEQIALRLAPQTGADVTVVRLFAVFHDSRRENESHDPEHGARGAALARLYCGKYFELDAARMNVLVEACTFHTSGRHHKDPTIGTCWDSDRLDLSRVGVITDPRMLSTHAAKDRDLMWWAVNLPKER
ncbi:MAG TPA: hypothetical protein VEK08_05800 [Planctomycetota bacterium]|nr:hypothetical protein [Planctomycetota bacterium]